jgi:beta-mannosidase
MRENYPVCTGILPWVFKRPWTTVAIQLVDGLGDPIAPYYAVKNAYAPLVAEIALREVSYAPGETFTPDLRLLCGDTMPHADLTVRMELYDPALRLVHSEAFACQTSTEESSVRFACAPITIPREWADRFFFMRAIVEDSHGFIRQSVYWPKVLARFEDPSVLTDYRQSRQNNMDFVSGPWLKTQIRELSGEIGLELIHTEVEDRFRERWVRVELQLTNKGQVPVFPIKLDALEDRTLCRASDNYFLLGVGETRRITATIRVKDSTPDTITVIGEAWNCEKQNIRVQI